MSRFSRLVCKLAMLCCLGLFGLLAVSLAGPSELRGQARDEIDFPFNDFENAPGRNDELTAAQIAFAIAFYGIILAVSVAILVLICYGLYSFLKALPPEFRLMEPGMVWLILIPCFNLVWIFFVYLQISRSYQNYFRAQGRYDVGDCGEAIGLWYCICVWLSMIPCVGIIASIASLILLVIYFVTLFGLKSQVQAGLAQPEFGAPM